MAPSAVHSWPAAIRNGLRILTDIPYENLSKAVDFNLFQRAETDLMQDPAGLLKKHRENGAGGTCFSLTWFLCGYLKQNGFDAYPVMCDRAYGKNTHCCAILRLEDKKYLLDPGFLAFRPILLEPDRPSELDTGFNSILLSPEGEGRFRLNTRYLNEDKYRFTLRDEAVADADFFECWRNSFAWESLAYPVVTMLKGDTHLYFQKQSLYVRRREGSERIAVPPEKMAGTLQKYFGISEELTKKAVEIFF